MKSIKGFKNVNVVTPNGIVKTSIAIENGKIKAIDPSLDGEGFVTLDNNYTVCPGFIDQHIHGAGGSDAMDGTMKDLSIIANALAKEGTTAFLATTMTQSPENIDKALSTIKQYIKENPQDGAQILGVHLEGPFISLKHVGAQPKEYVAEPKVETFKHYEEVSGGTIKLVSLAPEVEGAPELIKYLVSKEIVASIGHTDAKYDDVKAAIEAGASNVTHTYNAQRALHHRDIGVVGSALLFDELNCEAICDGIHLSPQAIKLLNKNKPINKYTLITDAMRAKQMPDGVSELGGQTVIVKNGEARLVDGTLAGSVLKMNVSVRNNMKFLNQPLELVVKYATENPAKNLKVFDKMGSIEVGKLANFVVLDANIEVVETIREGNVIFER